MALRARLSFVRALAAVVVVSLELHGTASWSVEVDGSELSTKNTTYTVKEVAEQGGELSKISELLLPDAVRPTREVDTYSGMTAWGGDDMVSYVLSNFIENLFQLVGGWWTMSGRYAVLSLGLLSGLVLGTQRKFGVCQKSSACVYARKSFFGMIYLYAFSCGCIAAHTFCYLLPLAGFSSAVSMTMQVLQLVLFQ